MTTAKLTLTKTKREEIRPCVKDVALVLNRLFHEPNKKIIIEGANATMLDIDFGRYLNNLRAF